MWFEIIPCFAIITTVMAFPHYAAYVANYLLVGNSYRRSLVTVKERMQYLRDKRIADGNPYKVKGIECIDDDTCKVPEKKKVPPPNCPCND